MLVKIFINVYTIQFINCYFEFLEYILPVITDLNAEFQSEKPKVYLLYSRMAETYKFILSCYIRDNILKSIDISELQYRNPVNFKPNEDIYFGPKVAAALSNNVLNAIDKIFFQTKCLEFYIELAKQIFTRFPFNSNEMKILKGMSFLDPKNVGNVESLGPIAQHFNNLIPDVNSLDREWRLFNTLTTMRVLGYSHYFYSCVPRIFLGFFPHVPNQYFINF